MPYGFGQVDDSTLNNVTSALQAANDIRLRSMQTKVQVDQDMADRRISTEAYQKFWEKTKPTEQTVKEPDESGKIIEKKVMKEPSVDDYIRAGAEAGEMLAQGGGRHSQAAAQRIHQFIDEKVRAKSLQPRSETPFDYWARTHPGAPVEKYPGLQMGAERIKLAEERQRFAEEKANREKVGTSPREKNAEKYRVDYLKENQNVGNMETYYGKDRLEQWREQLKKDPEARNVISIPSDFDRQKALDEAVSKMLLNAAGDSDKIKASQLWGEKVKAVESYEKSLSAKQAHHKALNGIGYRVDDDTGELIPVNPKEAKQKLGTTKNAGSRIDIPNF